MTNAERPFRIGQPGTPLPADFRQRIKEGMERMTPEAKSSRAANIRQHILSLSPQDLSARVFAMQNISPEAHRAMIEKSARTRTGSSMPVEVVVEQSTVWSKVKPLLARGASVPEAADITGLQRVQVKNALRRNKTRPEWQQIDREVNPEITRKRKSLSQKRRLNSQPLFLKNQENGNKLARAFLEDGIITDNLDTWNELRDIYIKAGREMPEDFLSLLRLEAFLLARKTLADSKPDLLIRYKELGESIDAEWFANSLPGEEKFIAQSLSPDRNIKDPRSADCVHRWIINEAFSIEVEGVCKHCGEAKRFQAVFQEKRSKIFKIK